MDSTFKTLDLVLSFAGIRIYSKTKWNSNSYFLFQIYSFITAVFALVFTTGFVVENISDTSALLKGASIWSTCIIMVISLGICLVFKTKLRNYLNEMAFIDFMLNMPFITFVLATNFSKRGGKIEELKILVESSQDSLMKFTKIFVKSYVFCVFLTATLYLCDPVYRMIIREDENERYFAYDMWFPWSNENFQVYIATFVYHAHAGYLCCIAYPGLQSTIILLVGQIIRQLKILTFILLNLNELIEELCQNKNEFWQINCTDVLSQCIKHYSNLKSFSNRLNEMCRPFYLTLILDATILVCMCSVQIAISDFTLEMLKFYIHEVSFIIMVFIFCFLGQKLENECERLENAVDEKWYIYNMNHKKNLLLFKMATQEGMPIYIFGSITLSLPTFTWFLRTEMSFFTLVMSLFEDE